MSNILITGAAGYIGGDLLVKLLSRRNESLKGSKIHALVRSQDQVDAISKLDGVSVHLADVLDEKDVEKVIVDNEIDLVVHTAGAADTRMPGGLLSALGKRRDAGAENLGFVHTSIASAYSVENGWPFGGIRDDGPVLQKERELADEHPVRKTNIFVTDQGRAAGVKTYIVPVPVVYGKGSGPVKKVSVNIPAFIRNTRKNKVVYQFAENGEPGAIQIDDLTALYAALVEHIVARKPIPSGEEGIYFGIAHRLSWFKLMDGLARNLYDRGMVNDPKPHTWPSWEQGADELGFPRPFIRAMAASSGEQTVVNSFKLGWKPQWTEEDMYERLDEDVQASLDFDTGKFTLFEKLIKDAAVAEV